MNENNSKPEFTIRYDKSEIAYVTQFLVSPGNEEVLVDLSSGLLNDANVSASGNQTLPIQTRIALPWSSAERLAKILTQVVEGKRQQVQSKMKKAKALPEVIMPEASLPQMTNNGL
jgi:hypothetical protein